MADMEVKKRYTASLALIERQLARVTDDLCDMICKQIMKVQHLADAELENYLTANQDKTNEIRAGSRSLIPSYSPTNR